MICDKKLAGEKVDKYDLSEQNWEDVYMRMFFQ